MSLSNRNRVKNFFTKICLGWGFIISSRSKIGVGRRQKTSGVASNCPLPIFGPIWKQVRNFTPYHHSMGPAWRHFLAMFRLPILIWIVSDRKWKSNKLFSFLCQNNISCAGKTFLSKNRTFRAEVSFLSRNFFYESKLTFLCRNFFSESN